MDLLTPEQIEHHLKNLPVEWALIGGSELERVYSFNNFAEALAFVNTIGKKAEEHNHHPDITLSWGKVIVRISTHSLGGLTKADFKLAREL